MSSRTVSSRSEYLRFKDEIEIAIRRVLDSGRVILGPEVEAFESEFAAFLGSSHAVGVKSGVDALTLSLRALEVGKGDEVITVANASVRAVSAIRAVEASPRFVDVDEETLLLNPRQLAAAASPRTRAIITVDLYGHPVDSVRIAAVAGKHRIPVIADCSESLGAKVRGRQVGTWATIGCFSFDPSKNLGGFGDGGMCATDDALLSSRLRRMRMYGFDDDRIAQCEGVCSRLDEIQAAMLRVKLGHFQELFQARRRLALRYLRCLERSNCRLPIESSGFTHAYHHFVVRSRNRDWLIDSFRSAEIGYGIHYPVPVHLMPAFQWLGYRPGDLPITERASNQVLSLPLHFGLTDHEVDRVVDLVNTSHICV